MYLIASVWQSPIGKILITANVAGLTGIYFETDPRFQKILAQDHFSGKNRYIISAQKWLRLYFKGKKPDFTPQMYIRNTEFQVKVWGQLLKIPYGETTTYKDIALAVAKDQEHLPIRAVAAAIGRNPISVIIPCHRVVGSNNNLTGYAAGIEKKIQLLQLEGIDTDKFSMPK